LGWIGRVDLLTVEGHDVHILDYKTGVRSEHHADQLRTYALLWFRRDDPDTNLPRATKLTLSYPSSDIEVPAPGADELLRLERDLVDRAAAVRRELQGERTPRPDPETCTFCSVRHLCDVYWRVQATPTEGSTDAEITVIARNGPRSFRAQVTRTRQEILLRTSEDSSLPNGSRWRVLYGYGVLGDNSELCVSVTGSSELYRLRST
jgi:hypothetical protein